MRLLVIIRNAKENQRLERNLVLNIQLDKVRSFLQKIKTKIFFFFKLNTRMHSVNGDNSSHVGYNYLKNIISEILS